MEYQPTAALARFAKVAIWICVGFAALVAVTTALEWAVLGQSVSTAPEEDVGAAVVGLGICFAGFGQIGAVIAAGVIFLTWLHRSSRNAQAMGAALQHSPGMAVGAWFIPCANAFIPYQVVRGLEAAALEDEDPGAHVRSTETMLWWGLWLGQGLVGWSAAQVQDDVPTMFVMDGISALMLAGAGFLLCGIIDRIQRGLDAKHARSTGVEPATRPLTF